jgi:N-acetylglutamate synthase-like GNAT family acetyltransferase
MMEVSTIRDAGREDADLLTRLIAESFRDVARRYSLTPDNCSKHPSNCQTSWVVADLARGVRYFIVSRHDEPVGCVGLEQKDADVAFLERLAVLPEHRRLGLGRSLVRHAIVQAQGNGSSRVSAAIIADHTELKEWYQRLGFFEMGTTTFPHLPFAVTFLELTISESANHRVEDITVNAPNPHP